MPVPLRRLFDYLPPGDGVPAPGCRCEVPFAGRRLVGVVQETGAPARAGSPLKTARALDDQPVLDPDLTELCRRAATYYRHPPGEVFHTALPGLLRKGAPARLPEQLLWRLTARGRFASPEGLRRAPRQKQALELLAEHPRGLGTPMLASLGVARSPLQALEKKGWVELVRADDEQPQAPVTEPLAEVPEQANPEQDAAIRALREGTGFIPWLLDGITGSGKTEVYLQAMAEHLRAGRQILVLVPEIGLTSQTIRRFRNRFRVPVAVMHSGLSEKERLRAWLDAREGRARIVLGTRSAVFTPLKQPGMIIVDEAHDTSFKQQDGFRYSARDLAVWRARILDIPVVLGTATPALETLHQAQDGRYRHLRLTRRAGEAIPPQLMLEDCRQLPPERPLSPRCLDALAETLQQQRQALVFVNRRGYAPMLLCNDCGWQAECPRCDVLFTWHRGEGSLRCHHCDSRRPVPRQCPECGSPHLRDMGAGTEKIEAVLRDTFPETTIIRIDRDSTRRKGSMDRHLAAVQQGEPAILVGTQMLAKGHHFPALDMAVVLEADSGFLSADFRGPEQAAQLLLQVAGRTGRGHRPGQVIIQTRHPEHPLLLQLLDGDYHRLAATLMEHRRMAGLPPFGYLALVRTETHRAEQAMTLLNDAAAALEADATVQVLGPVPAPMERRAGRWRHQLLLQSSSRRALQRRLPALLEALEQHPLSRHCRWHLDVDPVEML